MEMGTGIAAVALLVSFWSMYTTKRLWFLEHRPIVTAEVIVESSGVGIALLNLVIYNSGTRPATTIFLEAEQDDIIKMLSKGVEKKHREEIYYIFSKNAIIPLLLDSQSTKTAFFSFSCDSSNQDILLCNSSLPISIHYSDIKGKKYTSNMIISIKDKVGFGGSVWQ